MDSTVQRTSPLAVASLAFALASILIGPFGALPAIVCGHLAKQQIASNHMSGKGLAVAGLVLGYVYLAAFLLLAWFWPAP